MPSKTFHLDGSAGVMLIANYGINNAAITNPGPYLSQLNFHSDLEYLRIKSKVTQSSCVFPGLVRNTVYWDDSSKGGCF